MTSFTPFGAWDDHARDEINGTYDCDNCQQEVAADWFLAGDDLYETDCPHCGEVATVHLERDYGADAMYKDYRDMADGN